MKWRQAKWGLAVGTIYAMFTVCGTSTNPSGSLTLTPLWPDQCWPCSLSRYETGTLTIAIVYEGWANNRLYRFTSSSFPQLSGQGDSFVWVGSGSGLSGSYHITNTRGQKVDQVNVTATCRWDPVGSGGSGGGQDMHIDGSGTGIGSALGYYWNEANEHVKPVGEWETVYAWYGVGVPSPSSWTVISGPMTVSDYDTEADVHGTGISGSENDAVVKSVSDATSDSDTESFTFVGVDSLKYRIGSGGSWAVIPNPLVVSNGTAADFKAINAPSGAPWPSGKPVWSGASGSGDQASQTFTTPGTNLVTVECGNVLTGSVVVIKVEFSLNPVDNIIKGATAVPVTATVTPAALASSISFQANNGNVTVQGTAPNITVTGGAVGTSTVKAIFNGIEVGSFDASVIENPDFLPASGGVAAGAAPSQPLNGAWGLTWPENVAAIITAGRDGGTWRAIITSATGNYSLQAVLIAGCTEVTGPSGNTTSNNWVTQVANLNSLNGPTWYMVGAVQAHEQVHADKFDNGFQTVAVVDTLEANIENLTAHAANQAAAIAALSALPAFSTALTTTRGSWLAEILTLVAGDHATGGPCETAEHGVVDPMINTINTYAAAQGW